MKKDKLISYLVLLGIILGFPSVIYIFQNNGNITGYDGEYSYILGENSLTNYGALIFDWIVILMFIIYIKLIKKSEQFKGIKDIIFSSIIVGIAFLIALPNTSKDVFFYMGNGRAIDKYGINPYLTSVRRSRRIR